MVFIQVLLDLNCTLVLRISHESVAGIKHDGSEQILVQEIAGKLERRQMKVGVRINLYSSVNKS